jgi:hypothetical protein
VNRLLYIVPSRGRPENVGRLVGAWRETFVGVADLLVAVDEDDPRKDEYVETVRGDGFVWLEVGPPPERPGMAEVLNRYAAHYASSYRALGFMGDDHVPRTHGWDVRIFDELGRSGRRMVYGNDLLQRGNLPTAIAMLSDIPRALGRMVPGDLVHLYIDNAWLDIGRAIGISYLDDVIIEHMHPVAGKAPLDEGYARVNALDLEGEDRTRYLAWMTFRLQEDVRRIREAVAV